MDFVYSQTKSGVSLAIAIFTDDGLLRNRLRLDTTPAGGNRTLVDLTEASYSKMYKLRIAPTGRRTHFCKALTAFCNAADF